MYYCGGAPDWRQVAVLIFLLRSAVLLSADRNDRSNFSRTKFLFLLLSLINQGIRKDDEKSITCHFPTVERHGKQTRNGGKEDESQYCLRDPLV